VPLTFDGAALGAVRRAGRRVAAGGIEAGSGRARRFDEDLLFTHRGLSGPAVLQISSYWRPANAAAHRPRARHDLAALVPRQGRSRASSATNSPSCLPRRLADAWLHADDARLPQAARARRARPRARAWRRRCCAGSSRPPAPRATARPRSRPAASTPASSTRRQLESRRVPGLHFIGEVVDVTGWLGGYNFQWAWASAAACARAMTPGARLGLRHGRR
jgi:predicted flavoprotein YhiN